MKILLFGKDGQVGWELQRSLAALGDVVALDFDSAGLCGDFTRPDGLAQTIRTVKPHVIVNAAAHTAVDKAESEPELARTLNAVSPGVLAEEAERLGAWLVHYSTDYVFDGTGQRPWVETDTPSPINVYGQTKLEGEQLVAARCQRHLIFRTSWVYAARGGNFAKTMLRLAQERERLTVIDDQIGAPTGADLLADATAHALRQVQNQPEAAGLYHLVASGETTWHGYAKCVIEHARRSPVASTIRATTVDPVPTTAFPTPARRPLNSRMATDRLRTVFSLTLPPWQKGVERMLAEIL
ncbi:dTDP-4-dehydrorhamnose reductase [Candidatus Skiveiella danica]|uniref:dTDP-4-dehydrorhamnose reductase n=1 Tax=Candidatus Skiveiella danica TaxID=3386177 RepID=UPI001D4D5D93|nr:dTDP-4-dehydrorhamnose reductase [Betaproteobacteria bacterium]